MKFTVTTCKDFNKKCKNSLIKDFNKRMTKGNEIISVLFGLSNGREYRFSDIFDKLGIDNFIQFDESNLTFGNEGATITVQYENITFIQVKDKVSG